MAGQIHLRAIFDCLPRAYMDILGSSIESASAPGAPSVETSCSCLPVLHALHSVNPICYHRDTRFSIQETPCTGEGLFSRREECGIVTLPDDPCNQSMWSRKEVRRQSCDCPLSQELPTELLDCPPLLQRHMLVSGVKWTRALGHDGRSAVNLYTCLVVSTSIGGVTSMRRVELSRRGAAGESIMIAVLVSPRHLNSMLCRRRMGVMSDMGVLVRLSW